ncbi:MAG: hypothetical protein QNJ63_06205 [Calothrix sp. MO_192.B10]|nr:hypothetical protein [Calothrix sp. MO_192.B10]
MKLNINLRYSTYVLKLVTIALVVAIAFMVTPSFAHKGEAVKGVTCNTSTNNAIANQARQIVDELRLELAGVEDQIRNHPYLTALESGQVSQENLKAFAGEEYNIVKSDIRSNRLLARRFRRTRSGKFFRDILSGEVQALDLLLDFAKALNLNENDLKKYEPLPGAQAFPAYVASLALYGSEAEVGAAFLLNFPIFGENTGRMSAALQKQYNFTPKDTAFFDFFASPVPTFECDSLAVIATGLKRGAEPRLIKRAARLLQGYEQFFWDTVGEN